MGVLLGGFIDADPGKLEGATSYLAFVVPGLVASHAMTIAVSESTYPVMGAIKWHKTFYAQLATPLAVRDLVNAFVAFVVFRVASACAVFMLVLAPFGVFETLVGADPGVGRAGAGRHGLLVAHLRLLRATEVGGGLRRAVPPRGAAADALLRARSSRSPTSARCSSGSPGSRRCGTASRCRGCSASTPSTGRWPRCNCGVLVVLCVVGWRWAVTGLDKRLEV